MVKIFKPKNIRLDEQGMEKFLGELEAKIMECVWQNSRVTVREVRDTLASRAKDISFNAIMTIMNRLVEKGLLKKGQRQGIYSYEPLMSKQKFSRVMAKDIISSVLRDPILFSAASFSDVAKDLDKNILRKLKLFLIALE